MGWDTEVIIIGERIESKKIAIKIGEEIFEKDSKRYEKEYFFTSNSDIGHSIFYTYERRKYVPYWIIQEISKNYQNVSFTILGTMLEFLCGPGGIIRIKNGEIIDSYGIWGESSLRYQILDAPLENKRIIFEWFKTNGLESQLRNKFLNDFPLGWCNDNFVDKIIPISDDKLKKESEQNIYWEKQPNFTLTPTFVEYSKSLKETPQEKMEITEKSFISFVEYNKTVNDIDKEVIELLDGEILNSGHLRLYDTIFGYYSSHKKFSENRFKTIQDIENDLKKHRKEIIEWGIRNLRDKKKLKIRKGFSVIWLINTLKGIEK
jgi:hypothetical protein